MCVCAFLQQVRIGSKENAWDLQWVVLMVLVHQSSSPMFWLKGKHIGKYTLPCMYTSRANGIAVSKHLLRARRCIPDGKCQRCRTAIENLALVIGRLYQ